MSDDMQTIFVTIDLRDKLSQLPAYPPWARYCTIDSDGVVAWWENEPVLDGGTGEWYSSKLGGQHVYVNGFELVFNPTCERLK